MLSQRIFLAVLLLALLLGTAGFFLHQADYPLTYDEGDYWTAVQSGLWTNWTDNDDISVFEFTRLGFDAIGDPASRARLSDYIRASGSTMFYRHYHPPLAFYPAIVLQPLTTSLPLHWQLRLSNLVWLVLWIVALTLLGWRYEQARSPVLLILPASSAWAMAVVGYNMHLPFGLLASLFFLSWYLYEMHGQAGLKRAAQFFLAACFATVEYGMFVLFFLVLWGVIRFWKSSEKKRFLRDTLASAGWVLLFLILLWPAGVLNANLLKSWSFVMYIALFRLGGEPVAFAGWWTLVIEKWNANPVELLLLLGLLLSVLSRPRVLLQRGSLSTAVGFLLALLYLQINPTLVYRWYLFPAFAVGFLVLGKATEDRIFDTRDAAISPTAYTAGMGGFSILLFVAALLLVPKPDYSDLCALHTVLERSEHTHLTVPRSVLPQLRPYYPDAEIVSYHDVLYEEMQLTDSIPRWRAQGFVLLPAGHPMGAHTPDGEIGGWVYFQKIAAEEGKRGSAEEGKRGSAEEGKRGSAEEGKRGRGEEGSKSE